MNELDVCMFIYPLIISCWDVKEVYLSNGKMAEFSNYSQIYGQIFLDMGKVKLYRVFQNEFVFCPVLSF